MKRHIALLVCVLLLVTMLFVACDNGNDTPVVDAHQHTYGDVWAMDDTNHWHAATCKDGDDCATAKVSVAAHADADKNSICDVCGYDYAHTHTYATEFTSDESGHWYAVSCGCSVDVKDKAAHTDADNDGACDVCAYDGGHEHTFITDAWAMDENNHWHAAGCGHSVIEDEEAHDYDDMGLCAVCGYVKGAITVDKAVEMGEYYDNLVNGGHVDFEYDTWTKYQLSIDYLLGANSSSIVEKNLNYDEQISYWYMLHNGTIFGIEEYADGSIGKAYEPASALIDGYAFSQVFGEDDDAEDTFYGVTAMITGLYEMAKANPNGDLTEFIISYEGMPVYVFTFSQPIAYGDTVETMYQVQVAFALGEDYTYKYAYVASAKYNCEADVNENADAPKTYHTTNLVPNTVYNYYVEQTSGKRDLEFKYNPEAVFLTDYKLYEKLGFEDIFDDNGDWIGSNPILSETPLGDTITFEAGATFSMCFAEILPETAVLNLDNVEIIYDGGDTSYWNGTIMLFGGSQGTYTLTLKTAQTTRTFAVEITAPSVTEIYPTVSENGIFADKNTHTVYVDENGAASVIFSAGVNAYADGSFTATLAAGATGATLTDNGDGTYTLNITEVGTWEITITSKANAEISSTLTVTAAQAPTFDISDILSGKYEVTFFGMTMYEITFNPIAADGTAGTVTVVDNNNTGWTGTYDYLYAGGELTYSNADGVAAFPFYLDNALGTFVWNNNTNFAVTHTEAQTPSGGNELDGTYNINFMMDGLYVLTFDNGTLTIEDNNTTIYSGTYTYTGSPATGMVILNADGSESDIIIGLGMDGNPTFQCANLMMPQPLVKVEGDEGGDISSGPNGEYVVDFNGLILYTLTFDNGTLTIQDDNTNAYSGTYTYELNSYGGIDVYKDGELTWDIMISVSYDGSYTFQCPGLMMAQPLVPAGGGDEGGETSDKLTVGNNSVLVENAWMGTYIDFTAPATGNYTLAAAPGENNAFIMIEDAYGSEMLELPYSFYLWEGDTITFLVLTNNYEPDTIDLVVTQDGGSQGGDEPADNVLVLGENSVYVQVLNFWPQQTEMTFTAPWAGTFTLSLAAGELNADIYDAMGNWIENIPYTFTLEVGESITFNFATLDFMLEEDYIDIVITEGEAPAEEPGLPLVLGENSVYVTVTNFFQDQTKVTFTAPFAGTFTISWADGETNGDLYDAFGNWIEFMPYTFTLSEGEAINFYVQSADFMIAEDFIDIMITEGEAPAEEPGLPLVLGENSVYVTVTNFFQDQTKVTFTAPFAGTFTISWADGETNGDLYDAFGNWIEFMPYTFTLSEGEAINFYVQSADWEITEDYINVVIIEDSDDNTGDENASIVGTYSGLDGFDNVIDIIITDTTITFKGFRKDTVFGYTLNSGIVTMYLNGQEVTNPMSGYVELDANGVPCVAVNNGTEYQLTFVSSSVEDDSNGLDGTYHVNFMGYIMYSLTFDNGTLTIVDNWNGKYTGTYTYEGMPETGMTIYNADGSVSDILISLALNGKPTFQCAGMVSTYILEKDNGTDEPETELVPDSVLTIPEANELGAAQDNNAYTEEKYYVTGVITNVANTKYGNVYIKDSEGNEFFIYGLYTADGSLRYDAMDIKPVAGDIIVVHGVVGNFNGAPQMQDGWMTEYIPGEDEEEPETPDTPSDEALVVFDFGPNGDAAHKDGNDLGAEYSYTEGDYTLTLTEMSKVYGPAFDAKGNSCIKMGTGSKTGTLTFTVADGVNKVVIRVAAYKANAAKVTVNGTEYDVSANKSNDGSYAEIVIDTSSAKTVTVATVSGAYRAMIDSIAYYAN